MPQLFEAARQGSQSVTGDNPIDDLPPAATHRMDLPSITEFIDRAMERLPQGTVDLSNPARRNELRSWMTIILTHFSRETLWAYKKGTERGIEQVFNLIEDPDYYRTASERRRRSRERMRQMAIESARSAAAYRQEGALLLKEQVDSGKIALLNVRIDVEGLPDEMKGPKREEPDAND